MKVDEFSDRFNLNSAPQILLSKETLFLRNKNKQLAVRREETSCYTHSRWLKTFRLSHKTFFFLFFFGRFQFSLFLTHNFSRYVFFFLLPLSTGLTTYRWRWRTESEVLISIHSGMSFMIVCLLACVVSLSLFTFFSWNIISIYVSGAGSELFCLHFKLHFEVMIKEIIGMETGVVNMDGVSGARWDA